MEQAGALRYEKLPELHNLMSWEKIHHYKSK